MEEGDEMRMKYFRTSLIICFLFFLFFIYHRTNSVAGIYDILLGELLVSIIVKGDGEYKSKIFILSRNEKVIVKRENATGRLFLIGVFMHMPGETSQDFKNCFIPIKMIKLNSLNVVLNVNLNNYILDSC